MLLLWIGLMGRVVVVVNPRLSDITKFECLRIGVCPVFNPHPHKSDWDGDIIPH